MIKRIFVFLLVFSLVFTNSVTAFATYMGKRQPNGLIARRNDEIDMFLNGDYKRNSNYTRP